MLILLNLDWVIYIGVISKLLDKLFLRFDSALVNLVAHDIAKDYF